jgi:hypothetical protein
MGLVSQKINRIGVAGQATSIPAEYLPDNVVAGTLTNAFPSWKYGTVKRPSTTAVGQLEATTSGFENAFYHMFKGTDGNKYVSVINESGVLKVYNGSTGAAQTLYTPSGTGYLGNPQTNLMRAVTVGDYTFLVNQSKVVAAATAKYQPTWTDPVDGTDLSHPIAYVEVLQTDYSTPFIIRINDGAITVTVTTPANTSSATRASLETTKVATDLKTALEANAIFAASFVCRIDGSILIIYRNDYVSDFSIDVRDGMGEEGLRLTKDVVQSFDKLPPRAFAGSVVKIEGNPGSKKDDTWVIFENQKSDNGGSVDEFRGVWRETVKPNTPLRLDAATMPWALVKNGQIEPQKKQAALPPPPWVTAKTNSSTESTITIKLDPDAKYPQGYRIRYFLRTDSTIDYTADDGAGGVAYITGAEFATELVASFFQGPIDSGAGFSFTVLDGSPGEIIITVNKALDFSSTFTETPPAKTFWNWDLAMTPSEHVGRVLKNLTDKSSGTITANGTYHITVGGAFTGGLENIFREGDFGAVYGTQATYFVLDSIPWSDRLVGDLESSPWPSFLGRTISDVFFHENRMGFVSGEAVVMSAANDLFRLFRLTTTDVRADDPIDVKNATKVSAAFDAAVPWDTGVLLSGTTGNQFLLSGDPVMTPTSVRLDHLTSLPSTTSIRPSVVGKRVRFVRLRTDPFVDVYEIYRDRDGQIQIDELTKQNAKTIAMTAVGSNTPIKAMAADYANEFSALLARGVLGVGEVGKSIWVNCFHFDDNGAKVQNAWARWILPDYVAHMDVLDGELYVVVIRTSGTTGLYLEKIDISIPKQPFQTHQDAAAGGTNYSFAMPLQQIFWRDRDGNPKTLGRLQLRWLKVFMNGLMGQIQVQVAPKGRTTKTYTFTSADEGNSVKVPILCDSRSVTITIKDGGSSLGLAPISLEWEGFISEGRAL